MVRRSIVNGAEPDCEPDQLGIWIFDPRPTAAPRQIDARRIASLDACGPHRMIWRLQFGFYVHLP
jgi:hypothetical protein